MGEGERARHDMAVARVLDGKALRRLGELGGETLVREILGLFLENAPKRLEDARAGRRARNFDAVERAAGLATLAGDGFTGGPRVPMVPRSWEPDVRPQ